MPIGDWIRYQLKVTNPAPPAIGATPGSAGDVRPEPTDAEVAHYVRVLATADDVTRRKPLVTMDDLELLVAEKGGALKDVQQTLDTIALPKRLHDLFDAWVDAKRQRARYDAWLKAERERPVPPRGIKPPHAISAAELHASAARFQAAKYNRQMHGLERAQRHQQRLHDSQHPQQQQRVRRQQQSLH